MGFWRKIQQYFTVNTDGDYLLTDSFKTIVNREFTLYLGNLLQEDKGTIISRSKETWFYIGMYNYLMDCELISTSILESVDTGFPIGRMWNYCQQQQLTCSEWEDVEALMEETFLY